MRIMQYVYQQGDWSTPLTVDKEIQLVLCFGAEALMAQPDIQAVIHQSFPSAEVIGSSTSGEIAPDDVLDNSLCLTAIEFSHSTIHIVDSNESANNVGGSLAKLVNDLPLKDTEERPLRYVMVLANGHDLNGSVLVDELNKLLPDNVSVSGGLAGDNAQFTATALWRGNNIHANKIILCGFYGADLRVSHSSFGGWYPFGPEREVTSSEGNVLKSLDGRPALDLYKKYLGEHAASLPASALLFPLLIKQQHGHDLIRTVLGVDEFNKTMTFAGDIPVGSTVVLMHGNFEGLIEGALSAANKAYEQLSGDTYSGLMMIVSCVGRKLVLNWRTEEEVDAVKSVFGDRWSYAGFYSHGEISPISDGQSCCFHNETMTLTAITESHA